MSSHGTPDRKSIPAPVATAMVIAGAGLVFGCLALLHVNPRPEYLARDIATFAGLIFGGLMILWGMSGS